jgi:hypothetical protein
MNTRLWLCHWANRIKDLLCRVEGLWGVRQSSVSPTQAENVPEPLCSTPWEVNGGYSQQTASLMNPTRGDLRAQNSTEDSNSNSNNPICCYCCFCSQKGNNTLVQLTGTQHCVRRDPGAITHSTHFCFGSQRCFSLSVSDIPRKESNPKKRDCPKNTFPFLPCTTATRI